jgi:hypothetical protein
MTQPFQPQKIENEINEKARIMADSIDVSDIKINMDDQKKPETNTKSFLNNLGNIIKKNRVYPDNKGGRKTKRRIGRRGKSVRPRRPIKKRHSRRR